MRSPTKHMVVQASSVHQAFSQAFHGHRADSHATYTVYLLISASFLEYCSVAI